MTDAWVPLGTLLHRVGAISSEQLEIAGHPLGLPRVRDVFARRGIRFQVEQLGHHVGPADPVDRAVVQLADDPDEAVLVAAK